MAERIIGEQICCFSCASTCRRVSLNDCMHVLFILWPGYRWVTPGREGVGVYEVREGGWNWHCQDGRLVNMKVGF